MKTMTNTWKEENRKTAVYRLWITKGFNDSEALIRILDIENDWIKSNSSAVCVK